jgi:hypothetical protein
MTEMSPAEALFFAALERPPADRAVFLDQACAGDPDLRARIEQMLAAQSHLGGFLDSPAAEPAPTLDRTGPPAPPAGAPAPSWPAGTSCCSASGRAAWDRSGWPTSSNRSGAAWP